MARIKVIIALLCVLLVSHHVTAVVNKASSQASTTKEEEEKDSVAAEDRISNSYGPPADDYGPPPGNKYKGPAPVYGPPELTGDRRPTPIFDPPPPEQPPPLFNPPQPFSSYGPPSKPKPQYGPPKSQYGPPSIPKINFGPLKSQYGPPKPQYGPPKSQYGPPKSQFGPPKPQYGPPQSSFRPPKPEYGPPLKFSGPPSSQYGPPSGGFGGNSPGHGPPIPLSVEAYGPPTKTPVAPFVSKSQDDYGLPPPIQTAPQNQYGPPASNDIYGPPPPPPPGVPAPPTPPDIKYDGWQPIAGHVSAPNQQPPSDNYGPPPPPPSNDYGPPPSDNFVPPTDQYGPPLGGSGGSGPGFGSGLGHVSDNGHSAPIVSSDPNVLSDSYGVPLNNPEDHSLKSSVSQSTISHESNGLPPPALPQFEPLHNNQPPIDSSSTNNIDQHQISGQYGLPNEGLSIVKTVGFELLPNPEALTSDGHGNSAGSGTYISGQPSDTYGAPQFGGSHSSGGDDLSLQQLPAAPSNSYGPPPGPTDAYGPPFFSGGSAFSSSSSHGHRGFSSFNQFNSGFHKNNGFNRNRNRGGFRPPPPPSGGFSLPRRPPQKFRDTVPAGLLTNLNRYLPPIKPHKTYGPPSIQDQQLPSIQGPVSFHDSSSFASSSSFRKANAFSTALVAPNVHYGTPLSFNDFNTPAPSMTYGAPNFGPASSLGNGGNLYHGVETSVVPTYGAPSNVPDCQKNGGNFQYNFGNANSLNSHSVNFDISNQQSFSNAHAGGISSGSLSQDYGTPSINSVSNSLSSSYTAPNVNELDLQNHEQNQGSLKDSYGNPIGNSYGAPDQAGAAVNNHIVKASSEFSDSNSHSQNSLSGGTSLQGSEGLSAEALTAALTAQGYGEAKNIIPSTEVDATQFIKSDEGGQALALAQTLTADGDGFQIQGSQGTYMLQIQPADGGYGTGNSDGNIRHDQVLSNGLLQNILAAIEQQPEGGQVQLQGLPQSLPQTQQLEQLYSGDLAHAASSSIVSSSQFESLKSAASQDEPKQLRGDTSPIEESDDQDTNASEDSKVALFFNQSYESTNKESRSVSKSEKQPEDLTSETKTEEKTTAS